MREIGVRVRFDVAVVVYIIVITSPLLSLSLSLSLFILTRKSICYGRLEHRNLKYMSMGAVVAASLLFLFFCVRTFRIGNKITNGISACWFAGSANVCTKYKVHWIYPIGKEMKRYHMSRFEYTTNRVFVRHNKKSQNE